MTNPVTLRENFTKGQQKLAWIFSFFKLKSMDYSTEVAKYLKFCER
jgi:hypothetical protein